MSQNQEIKDPQFSRIFGNIEFPSDQISKDLEHKIMGQIQFKGDLRKKSTVSSSNNLDRIFGSDINTTQRYQQGQNGFLPGLHQQPLGLSPFGEPTTLNDNFGGGCGFMCNPSKKRTIDVENDRTFSVHNGKQNQEKHKRVTSPFCGKEHKYSIFNAPNIWKFSLVIRPKEKIIRKKHLEIYTEYSITEDNKLSIIFTDRISEDKELSYFVLFDKYDINASSKVKKNGRAWILVPDMNIFSSLIKNNYSLVTELVIEENHPAYKKVEEKMNNLQIIVPLGSNFQVFCNNTLLILGVV